MKTLSATDLAIALAAQNGTLKVIRCWSERLKHSYYAIEDNKGLIEVQNTMDEVSERLTCIVGEMWRDFSCNCELWVKHA